MSLFLQFVYAVGPSPPNQNPGYASVKNLSGRVSIIGRSWLYKLTSDGREKIIIPTGEKIMLISYSYKKLFKFETKRMACK